MPEPLEKETDASSMTRLHKNNGGKNLGGEILIFAMCGREILSSYPIIFLDNKNLASGAEQYPIHTALTRSWLVYAAVRRSLTK